MEVKWEEDELAKNLKLGTFSNLIVASHENAFLLKDGKIYEEYLPGKHLIKKMPWISTAHVVYVLKKPFKLIWGLPESLTIDNVSFSCNGVLELKIEDSKKFYMNLMGNTKSLEVEDLEERFIEKIQGILKSELGSLQIRELYLKRDDINSIVRTKIGEFFKSFGIDFKSIEITGLYYDPNLKREFQSMKFDEIEHTKREKRANNELNIEKLHQDAEMYKSTSNISKRKAEHDFEINKAKDYIELDKIKDLSKRTADVEKYIKLAKEGIDATKFKELEILENNPNVMAKKFEGRDKHDSEENIRCTGCGTINTQGSNYCKKCGNKLIN